MISNIIQDNKILESKNIKNSEFECSICLNILISPVIINCGHTFCETCIDKWLKDNNVCPLCKNTLANKKKIINLILKEYLYDTIVVCKNLTRGCDWNGKYFKYVEHIDLCGYELITCPHSIHIKCDKLILKKNIDGHIKEYCVEHLAKYKEKNDLINEANLYKKINNSLSRRLQQTH